MPAVARVGDIGSGHASFPPTAAISGSGNGFVNSIPVHRQGDALASHGSPSPSPPHGRALASGSSNTYLNSKQIGIIGSPVACGGLIITGSGNTFIN